jgi:hypothetical protein
MFILGATVVLDWALRATLVGIAYFALFGHRMDRPPSKRDFLALFAIFAFLGLYELPAIVSLDATITVRNPEIVRFFELEPHSPLLELYSLDWFDLFIWMTQSALALFVGERLRHRFRLDRSPDHETQT